MTAGARAIRLVTFDLDNTLWPIDGVIEQAETRMWTWLHTHAGLARPDGAALAASRAAVLEGNPGLEHDISRLRERVVRMLLECAGHSPEAAAPLAAGAFAEFLNWRHRVRFFPDALAALEALRPHYTLAALTNGNADYRRLGLDRHFTFGLCAADVGASKPHPAMFERALARANAAPAEAVHVGDHPVNDIQAAQAVGMATIQVDMAQTPSGAPNAPTTIARLRDLPAAIAALG